MGRKVGHVGGMVGQGCGWVEGGVSNGVCPGVQ